MDKKKRLINVFVISILTFLCGTESKHIDRTAFWTMMLAIFTATLFILGYREIVESRNTRNAQFLMDFNHFTSTEDERQLTMLIDNDLLTFKENNPHVDTVQGLPQNFPCFIINK